MEVIFGSALTLLELVQCELALGDMVYVELLGQDNKERLRLSDDPIEEAITFLRRQAAWGRILRIFPLEHYLTAHNAEFYIKHGALVRMGDRLYQVEFGDFRRSFGRSRIEIDKLFRKDRCRVVLG